MVCLVQTLLYGYSLPDPNLTMCTQFTWSKLNYMDMVYLVQTQLYGLSGPNLTIWFIWFKLNDIVYLLQTQLYGLPGPNLTILFTQFKLSGSPDKKPQTLGCELYKTGFCKVPYRTRSLIHTLKKLIVTEIFKHFYRYIFRAGKYMLTYKAPIFLYTTVFALHFVIFKALVTHARLLPPPHPFLSMFL